MLYDEEERERRRKEAINIINQINSSISKGNSKGNINLKENNNLDSIDYEARRREAIEIIRNANPVKEKVDKSNKDIGNLSDNKAISNNNEKEENETKHIIYEPDYTKPPEEGTMQYQDNATDETSQTDKFAGRNVAPYYNLVTKQNSNPSLEELQAAYRYNMNKKSAQQGGGYANRGMLVFDDEAAQGHAEILNKKVENGDKLGVAIEVIGSNMASGMIQSITGLQNVVTTAIGLGAKGVKSVVNFLGNEELSNEIDNFYNDVTEKGSQIHSMSEYTGNVTARLDNGFIRTVGQVTNTVSEMATNATIGLLSGANGTKIQGLSIAGRSAQEVLDENPEAIGKATITGLAKGYTSYLTERMFDANILTKGQGGSISNKVDELIFNTIKSKFGREFANKTVGIIGENLEEIVEDNIDNVIDNLINDKDFPTIQEWLNNTTETIKITTLSTIVMSLLGLGGESFRSKESEIIGRKVQKIIDKGGYGIQYDENVVAQYQNLDTFFTTQFDNNGNVDSITQVVGKPFKNPNDKVNIAPAIFKNAETGYYNVVDTNTGVLMDSTPYPTTLLARINFESKMANLDLTSIRELNNRIVQADSAIKNKIAYVYEQARAELISKAPYATEEAYNLSTQQNQSENVENNNSYMTTKDLVENINRRATDKLNTPYLSTKDISGILNGRTTNDMSNTENSFYGQNNVPESNAIDSNRQYKTKIES